MNVRPGTEKMVPKNVRPMVTPYRPKVGMTVPKDARLLHRSGKAIKDADGRIIGRDGEQVKLRRKTVCGMRDHAALAGKKVGQFVYSREGLDSRLDAVVLPSGGPVSGCHNRRRTGHVRLSAKV